MFTLAFDRRHKILLARVSGVLGSSDVAAVDDAISRFTARNGPAHSLMDFSAVSTVAVPIARLLPSNGASYKRIVIAKSEMLELARTAVREPTIVSSLDEALRQLGAASVSFEPVEA